MLPGAEGRLKNFSGSTSATKVLEPRMLLRYPSSFKCSIAEIIVPRASRSLFVSSRVLGRDWPGLSFPFCIADRNVSLSQLPRPCSLNLGGIANSKVDRKRTIVCRLAPRLLSNSALPFSMLSKQVGTLKYHALPGSNETCNWSKPNLRIWSFRF